MTMHRTPLDMMFDRVDWRCTRCGAKRGSCGCWWEVQLRCPQCKRTKFVMNEKHDPPGTAVVEAVCDRCEKSSDRPEVLYFDASGRQFDGEKFAYT